MCIRDRCGPEDRLALRLGAEPGAVWVKDETGNVGGSHKARHLVGILLHLLAAERLTPGAGPRARHAGGDLPATLCRGAARLGVGLGHPDAAVHGPAAHA